MWRSIIGLLVLTAQFTIPLQHGRGSVVTPPLHAPLSPLHAPLSPTHTSTWSGGYPRLANYNGFTAPVQAPFFAAYDLVIARRGAPIGLLSAANRRTMTLLYERTLQTDLCCMSDLYGIDASRVPPGWWLVGAGSRLPLSIGPDQDWIPVADPRPFAPCQDILVDGESMHVWSVEGNWLHVLRGYNSTATAHKGGARVAPHLSYRVDLSNCQITGPAATLRPWSFNLSSRCPRWHGLTWAGYLARRIAYLVRRDGWGGVFYDNLNDLPFSPLVDTNNDGRADGGIVHGVNVWEAGERALLAETRALLPHYPVLVNGDLRAAGLADGREIEGFPVIPGLALSASIDSYLAAGPMGMPMTIVNPDTLGRPTPRPATAMLGLGVSLLGDGYAAYDQGWSDHGSSWWFDAYDNGSGTALRLPVGPWTARFVVAHPWGFRVGDTVLLDQEAAVVTGVTPHTITVERGMGGTVAATHPAGTNVTTAWQRLHGHGYLGSPLGPAHLVATGPWEPFAAPMSVAWGTGATPLLPATAMHPLDAQSQIVLRSHLRYDFNATGLTLLPSMAGRVLRTLVFSARGPAGAPLWIGEGATAVPVTLQPRWHRYVLPVGHDARITIGTGRAGGAVFLRGFHFYATQAFVWRRDFSHGIVLVNPTDRVQHLTLNRPYLLPPGDQEPWGSAARLICTIMLGPYHAAVLLNATAQARCPTASSSRSRRLR